MAIKRIHETIYHQIEGLNWSSLKELKKSPEQFLYAQNLKPTQAQEMGSFLHSYLLEPEECKKTYAIMPQINRRTKAGKEEYNQLIEKYPNRKWVNQEEANIARELKEYLSKSKIYKALTSEIVCIESAVTFYHMGVSCKMKLDMLSRYKDALILTDLKSCRNIWGFNVDVKKYDYISQLAYYGLGLAYNNINVERYILVALSKKAPYISIINEYDKKLVESRIDGINELMQEYINRKQSNHWVGDLYNKFTLEEEL